MRIATYNIWNSQNGMPFRENHILIELKSIDADIICLQEVRDRNMAENIAESIKYNYCYFESYHNECEGLAIISKIPFTNTISLFNKANTVICTFEINGKKLCIANIHLPWDSTLNREKQIVETVSSLENEPYDYVLLAGDFNCNETSDVNRFLIGECSLNGKESKYIWYDLARSYAERNNTRPEFTLNFTENPRFENNTIEINSRVDRIMLRNTYPADFPVLTDCRIFGQKIYNETELAASDHYGLIAELEL